MPPVDGRSVLRYVPRPASEWDGGLPWQVVDGSLVFLDISGFTSLSERLTALGRIGAEELIEVLNGIFGRMLDLAFARGGSLLKFGGDALLLLFTGPDHATQACAAAVETRAALRARREGSRRRQGRSGWDFPSACTPGTSTCSSPASRTRSSSSPDRVQPGRPRWRRRRRRARSWSATPPVPRFGPGGARGVRSRLAARVAAPVRPGARADSPRRQRRRPLVLHPGRAAHVPRRGSHAPGAPDRQRRVRPLQRSRRGPRLPRARRRLGGRSTR